MLNLRTCSAAAGGAFLLSILAGFIGGADFLTILIRAFIFAAAAFGFAAGAQQLISLFLPELAGSEFPSSAEQDAPADESGAYQPRVGEKIDVSVGDDDDDLSQFVAEGGNEEERALAPSGLDQRSEGGYTEGERSEKSPAARPPDLIGNVDVLPDLEGFSDSFVTPISSDESVERTESRSSYPASSASSSSTATGAGQFDAKEMAMAIQTILKRDQKG